MDTGDTTFTITTNVVLLGLLTVFVERMEVVRTGPWRPWHSPAVGVVFGIAAVLSMSYPIAYAPGYVWDTRHVIVGVSGLLAGPLAGLIAASASSGYRIWLGGVGVPGGIASVLLAAALGSGARYALALQGRALREGYLPGIAVLFGLAGLSSYLFVLDQPGARALLVETAPPFFAFITVAGYVFVRIILLLQRRRDLERHLTAFTDSFPSMIYRRIRWPDGSLSLPFVSRGITELYGVSADAAQRDPALLEAAVHEDDRAEFRETLVPSQESGVLRSIEYRLVNGTGPWKWVSDHFTTVAGSSGELISDGIILDVTAEHNRAQLALERQQNERANRIRSELLASMAHELRTPLNAIVGFTQLIGSRPASTLSSKDREYLGIVESSSRQLMTLVEDLLDLSTMEAGRLRLAVDRCDVTEAVRACAEQGRALVGEMPVSIHADVPADPVLVSADRTRLAQILLNFASNAVKYNRPDGTVRLAISDTDDGRVEISVTDTGIGIPESDFPRVFEAFDRLGRENGTTPGFGLGLAMAKRVADAMDAEIGFESSAGVGSRFWVRLVRAE